jgi:hypothetical protein
MSHNRLRHPSRQKRNLQTGLEYPKVFYSIYYAAIFCVGALNRRADLTAPPSYKKTGGPKHSEAGTLQLM